MATELYTTPEIRRRAEAAIEENVSLTLRPGGATVKNRSKGTTYTIDGGKCSCPAGRFGGHCKHVALYIVVTQRGRGRNLLA